MTLLNGYRLGSYEIVAPLGAGGMGEVYLARDARLGREVALKVLPEAFLADPERLSRFDREAHLLASLNHANVAAIYGFEEADGLRFLVLELVPGETLAERFARGPLELDEALALFRQIADALESAHEKGIVHRDLKPANIKVTPGGKVKVLDFGLGKVFEKQGRSSDLSRSPTITHGATHQGVILGTAAYMSPEQARGKPVDKRTDIWSFGCVLFEALTGRQAFAGDTTSDLMASVLTREPDWSALPAATPARVRDLLRRCLQKDPDRRLHDIADARLEIEEAAQPSIGATPVSAPTAASRRRFGLWSLAAAVLVGAALASYLTWRWAGTSAAVPETMNVTRLARLTHGTDRSDSPAWSPDGSLLAYSSDRSGNFEIYVRGGEGSQDVNVTNDPAQDVQPAFSPAASSIAFVSTRSSRTGLIKIGGTLARNTRTYGGDLWVVAALGGAARRLASDANYPVWRPDGRAILYVSGPENSRSILEVAAEGGAPRAVLPSESSDYEITWMAYSPDGRWISFETQLEGILAMPAGGGKPQALIAGSSHAWDASSGRLYFVTRDPQGGGRVQSVAIDSARGAVRGAASTISLMTANLRDLAVSRDGLRVAIAEEEATRHLTRLPLAPDGGAPAGAEEALSSGRVTDSYPSVSPDGRQIAYVSDILGHNEVWILDLETRRRRALQLPGEDIAQVSPAWFPDSRRLAIGRWLEGGLGSNWVVAVDGSQAEEHTRGKQGGAWTMFPSPDGKKLALPVRGQLFLYDLDSRKSTQLTVTPGAKFDGVWSPDGRWIAYTGIKDGMLQLFRVPSSGGQPQQLTTGHERMRHPFFSPDGRWIYIQPSHRNIYRVPVAGGPLEAVTRFPEGNLFLEEPTISPDGRSLIYCRGNEVSSLWLLTLERPGGLGKAK